MRALTAIVLASSLMVSSAMAASVPVGALVAGKPAGAKEAALIGPSLFFALISVGVLVGGLALTVSNDAGNDGVTTPVTTSTRTTALP